MEFDTNTFTQFRIDLGKALEPLEDKYGLRFQQGNIRYSKLGFNLKLDAKKSLPGENIEKKEFEKYCRLFGFEPMDYRREFTYNKECFCLIGFHSRNPKNNCEIQNIRTGKNFNCTDAFVKQCFKM